MRFCELLIKGNAFLEDETSASGLLNYHSTPKSLLESTVSIETPVGSLFSPTDMDTDIESVVVSEDCQQLEEFNVYLKSRDISPVRSQMKIPWEEASERTKRRYLRKSKQVVTAVLNDVAPNQAGHLWQSLVASKPFNESSSDEDKESECVDPVLMKALSECYHNADSWATRRQMASIVADKVPFKTLKYWIPDLTRYRYSCARKHVLVHGRGVAPPQPTRTRMAVSRTQLDHFLDFITSPHVIQDLPFGEKSVKLSTKEVI